MRMLDKLEIPRKMCPVIFLLDTSGSMIGAPIATLNSVIENIMPELIAKNDSNPDVEIRVAIMTFGDEAKWVIGGDELLSPEEVQNSWNDLDAGGVTSMGAALIALNDKLSVSHGFMKHVAGSVAPVLFLFMDGEPTDDYKSALAELRKNNWYKIAKRVAVGYGAANDDILREFVGNGGIILHTLNPTEIIKHISYSSLEESYLLVEERSAKVMRNLSSRAKNATHTIKDFSDDEW